MEKVLPSGLTEEQVFTLRSLVHKRDGMQDARIVFENKIRAISSGTTPLGRMGFIPEQGLVEGLNETNPHSNSSRRIMGLSSYEKLMEKEMKDIVEGSRIWVEWLSNVRGIDILTAAKIIAYFEPYWAGLEIPLRVKKQNKGKVLDEAITVTKKLFAPASRSALGKLCGYIVDENGRAVRRERGKKCVGNPMFKAFIYKMIMPLQCHNTKAKAIMDKYHEYYKTNYANYLMRNFNGATTRKDAKKVSPYVPSTYELAQRHFSKLLISLIWEKFQEVYNLPITTPQHIRNKPLTKKEWIHPADLMM
jgi:hypothetical protein